MPRSSEDPSGILLTADGVVTPSGVCEPVDKSLPSYWWALLAASVVEDILLLPLFLLRVLDLFEAADGEPPLLLREALLLTAEEPLCAAPPRPDVDFLAAALRELAFEAAPVDFLEAAFLAAPPLRRLWDEALAVPFLAADFLEVVFLALAFLAAPPRRKACEDDFLPAAFFADDFLAVLFLGVVFFVVLFVETEVFAAPPRLPVLPLREVDFEPERAADFFELVFFETVFLAAELLRDDWGEDFLAAPFLAADFFAEPLEAGLFTADFLTADFFEAVFFAVAFLPAALRVAFAIFNGF